MNRQRLKGLIEQTIGNRLLVTVSHSEPYITTYIEGEVKWKYAAGGLVTALDPIMEACGGLWVAYGAGDADKEVVDSEGKVNVPPDSPNYALKRVSLSKSIVDGYLNGISNRLFWPLCHFVYVRPRFSKRDWEQYKEANKIFADAVLSEIKEKDAFVWTHDYHMCFCSKYVKEKRPETIGVHFWHIPWPGPEIFKICPWAEEILEGLLMNDLIGFQTKEFAANFMDCVDQTLEARIDRISSSIFFKNRETRIRDFPISIDFENVSRISGGISEGEIEKLKRYHGIKGDMPVVVGVDRLDYTKGIPEKLLAIRELLSEHPELRKKFVFVQVASPTRAHVYEYQVHGERVLNLVDKINWQYSEGAWKPVVFISDFIERDGLIKYLKMGQICLITSLHDGMNLVSKEFVAARNGDPGVLILSKFAGSINELKDAIMINPYSVEEIKNSILKALVMSDEEKRTRMSKMREEVKEHDVFRWAAELVRSVSRLKPNAYEKF
ncbi:trehalose-6-phosphate synthase [Candidatus Micrarchaeota archaeon]|nr:trehalose-6-phosphate synthase [Candidatus Micrarchaeota archaeon]